MEYGRPGERTREKLTAMEIVHYAVKSMRESIIYGGNVERLTSTQILDTLSFFKPDKKNIISRSVSGMLE
eukprot:11354411-Heterocapsa_arctica.AAC.1